MAMSPQQYAQALAEVDAPLTPNVQNALANLASQMAGPEFAPAPPLFPDVTSPVVRGLLGDMIEYSGALRK